MLSSRRLATVVSSPRSRRRLTWIGAGVGVVGAVAAVFALIPSHGPPKPVEVTTEGLAQLAAPTSTHVPAASRRAIDRVLDRFIPAAVGRSDAKVGWSLAGPEMKASTTFADWRAWNVPVPAYPVQGTSFHDWTVVDAGHDYVDFNLLVHPRKGASLGAWVFDGEMVRRDGAWLVNRLYTIAIMQPVRGSKHEIGPADFVAPGASGTPAGAARLGGGFLLIVVAILLLVVVAPLALGVLALRRRARWRAQGKARNARLPPLPSSSRAEHEREPAGRH